GPRRRAPVALRPPPRAARRARCRAAARAPLRGLPARPQPERRRQDHRGAARAGRALRGVRADPRARGGRPYGGVVTRRLVVEADGGSRGNPGPAGWGAVVRDAATGALLAER